MKDIVIVGHGGFSKDIVWMLDRINSEKPTWNMIGYVENEETSKDLFFGNDEYLLRYDKPLYVAFGIGDPTLRYKLQRKFSQNQKLLYPNLIDPSVAMAEGSIEGIGNVICANTAIVLGSSVGSFNIINLACTIGHDVKIRDFVTISPGANISGNVHLLSGCEIGTGAQVLQGCTIGSGTKIGAGAVVVSDMPEDCTAVGVPAKIIKYRGGSK